MFLLTFRNGDKLVVKWESRGGEGRNAAAESNIRWAAKMMKQVDSQIKARFLTSAELASLDTASKAGIAIFDTPESRAYLELMTEADAQRFFAVYKMPYVSNLTDVKAKANKNELASMLLQLDDEALNTLGKIVAVDLFNGNVDRFDHDGQLTNEGNLLFQSSNGKLTPIGLDYYEAQGAASNLDASPPTPWVGMNLLNESAMRNYAQKAIDGLNGKFQKLHDASLPPLQLLKSSDAKSFANGIVIGARTLRAYLGQKSGLPTGVLERMKLLIWPLPPPARPGTLPPRWEPTGRTMYVTAHRKRGMFGKKKQTFAFEERQVK